MSGDERNLMHCKNCGAPLALVGGRNYFYCEYCRSYFFPAASSDEVVVLDGPLDDVRCPACKAYLARASVDGHNGWHCQNCHGFLLDQSSFANIAKVRRALAQGPSEQPPPLNREELKRSLTCPSCQKALDAHPYYGPGNVVVDTCARCHLIWLDHGKLRRIIRAPGRDRGD
ncbi:MAG: zf-TFIIB domain-containing protein [Anaerolineae bacterium]